jgi:hypothetical protein
MIDEDLLAVWTASSASNSAWIKDGRYGGRDRSVRGAALGSWPAFQ